MTICVNCGEKAENCLCDSCRHTVNLESYAMRLLNIILALEKIHYGKIYALGLVEQMILSILRLHSAMSCHHLKENIFRFFQSLVQLRMFQR